MASIFGASNLIFPLGWQRQLAPINSAYLEKVKMRRLVIMAIAALLTVSLSGCLATTGGSNEATGTAVGTTGGAILGGIIANNTGGNTALGALIGGAIGGIIGNRIGRALDEQERRELARLTERAATAKANKTLVWRGPKKPAPKTASTSDSGKKAAAKPAPEPTELRVTAGEIYTKSDGQQCRNIQQVAIKDGKRIEDSATACKTDSGWSAAAV